MIFQRNTAALLARADEDLAAVETAIGRLQQERSAKLLTIMPAEVALLDQRIADQERARQVFLDRRAGFEARLADEAAEQRLADYKAAAAKMPAAVRRRYEAALALEQALIDFGRVAKRYAAISVLKGWPDDIELPNGALPRCELVGAGYIDTFIREVFGPYGITDFQTRRPVQDRDFAAHAIDAAMAAKSRGFAAAVQEAGKEWIDCLHHAHDPVPVEDLSEDESESQADEEAA